jgi:hypothetical protein
MERSKLLKTALYVLLAIVAVYIILIILKKTTKLGEKGQMLGNLWSPLGEQEHFRFHYEVPQFDPTGSEYYRYYKDEVGGVGNAEYYRYANPNKDAEQYRYYYADEAPVVTGPTAVNPEMQSVPMRPNLSFGSPLYGRFDGNQTSSNMNAQSSTPIQLMASPPSGSPLDAATFDGVDFQELGGQGAPIAVGGLTTQQVSDILKDRVGSGKPELQSTKDLMPVPDMRYTTGLDPTNPENFMYDRTIFGRLKRRYGNGVDFFRGDIDVKPEYRGWFDLQPPQETDIVTGYFDRYIDIQQETAIKDASFTRSTPIEDLYKASVNPGGKTYLTMYDHY